MVIFFYVHTLICKLDHILGGGERMCGFQGNIRYTFKILVELIKTIC
jgi:hypothetical protein